MTTCRSTRPGWVTVFLSLIILALVAGAAAPEPAAAQSAPAYVVWPLDETSPLGFTVASGATQEFTAYRCPADTTGRPSFGPDGTPASGDDGCVPVVASWSMLGDLGSLAPNPAPTTTLTAAILAVGALDVSGGLLATVSSSTGPQTAGISVTVLAPTNGDPGPGRLAFLDGVEQETADLGLLRMGPVRAMFLASLTSAIARREARGGEATRGELRLLERLVTTDFRHRVVARDLPPGTGNAAVVATLTSYGPDGDVVDEIDVVLEPDGRGSLEMVPQLVLIDPATRSPFIPGKKGLPPFHFEVPDRADGLVFLTAVEGGRVEARAPDVQDALGHIVLDR